MNRYTPATGRGFQAFRFSAGTTQVRELAHPSWFSYFLSQYEISGAPFFAHFAKGRSGNGGLAQAFDLSNPTRTRDAPFFAKQMAGVGMASWNGFEVALGGWPALSRFGLPFP